MTPQRWCGEPRPMSCTLCPYYSPCRTYGWWRTKGKDEDDDAQKWFCVLYKQKRGDDNAAD